MIVKLFLSCMCKQGCSSYTVHLMFLHCSIKALNKLYLSVDTFTPKVLEKYVCHNNY